MFEKISSFQNAKIKLTKKLRDKRSRERDQLFVIDYERDLERALRFDYAVEFMFYCSELDINSQCLEIIDHWQLNDRVYEVGKEMMQKVAYRSNPSAIVAVIKAQPISNLDQMNVGTSHRSLVLVDLKKPGNIGALLRTADATRMDSIILVDTSLDIYNPNIIRSSTGACFQKNIYSVTSDEALRFFREQHFYVIGTYLEGESTLYDVNFPQRMAVVMGTEDIGLSSVWAKACDQIITIPMHGETVDSLNVSVSGAVVMYESLRQQLYK